MQLVQGWRVPDADTYVARKLGAAAKGVSKYQRKDLMLAAAFAPGRRLALDVGGHIGTSAATLSAMFGQVASFEPSPDTHECFVANMAQFAWPNVECHNVALSDGPGRASLVADDRDQGNVGARSLSDGDEVRVDRLDAFGFIGVDFVKIDVEGFESLVLLGGEATLRRERPVIMFEDRGFAGRVPEGTPAPQSILGEWGAKLLLKLRQDEVWGWPDNIAAQPA